MITTRSIIMNNNFSITITNRICIQIFRWEMKIQCLFISTSTLLATVDSTEYHFIIKQINGITFVRNSAILTKYGTVDEVEFCLKILSTKDKLVNLTLFHIIKFLFFFFNTLNAHQEKHST